MDSLFLKPFLRHVSYKGSITTVPLKQLTILTGQSNRLVDSLDRELATGFEWRDDYQMWSGAKEGPYLPRKDIYQESAPYTRPFIGGRENDHLTHRLLYASPGNLVVADSLSINLLTSSQQVVITDLVGQAVTRGVQVILSTDSDIFFSALRCAVKDRKIDYQDVLVNQIQVTPGASQQSLPSISNTTHRFYPNGDVENLDALDFYHLWTRLQDKLIR